ncbi:MAG: glycosyltransferase family 2 protein [Bacteroidota bacterium]
MKISIITVTYNAARYLRTCVESVLDQNYPDLEYIVIDGASTDGTQEILAAYADRIDHFISEPDQGLYHAMNKGIAMATGEVIGLLNADDFYAYPEVISEVMGRFADPGVQTVFGDLIYVDEEDIKKVVRYFPGKGFHHGQMKRGLMPPHPTFFVRQELYNRCGGFDTQFDICADFDLMVRWFHRHEVAYSYLPKVMVHMRTGGSSTQGLSSTARINQEMLRSLRQNGVKSNLPLIYSKYLTKVFQLFKRPADHPARF